MNTQALVDTIYFFFPLFYSLYKPWLQVVCGQQAQVAKHWVCVWAQQNEGV